MSRLKILLVGDYPPPYGGISVQIEAIQQYLSRDQKYDCKILDIGESRSLKKQACIGVKGQGDFLLKLLTFASRQYVIHIITNGANRKSWICSLACSLAGLLNGRRTILTLGSGLVPNYLAGARFIERILIRLTLALAGKVICQNSVMKQTLLTYGIPESKIKILSGFLWMELPRVEIPEKVLAFQKNHSPLIGSIVAFREEYGIPLLFEAIRELTVAYPRIGLCLIGSGGDDQPTDKLIQSDGLSERILIMKNLPHWVCLGVVGRLDIFVRATYFDGDSLSVKEALSLGVPVVASDTDFRPSGVIKFRKGDLDDLVKKMLELLKHRVQKIERKSQPSDQTLMQALCRLYQER